MSKERAALRRDDLIAAISHISGAVNALAEAWDTYLVALKAAREAAFAVGGSAAADALCAELGVTVVGPGTHWRMDAAGLGPVLDLTPGRTSRRAFGSGGSGSGERCTDR